MRTDKGDYDVNDLGERITQYLAGIAHAIRENTAFRKTLIFLPLIKTSLAMRDQCRAVGLSCEHIDGTSEDRKEILQRFARNEFDVLCNAMLLTEGYDCPDVDTVVCLRPTKIRSLYCQMVGRGTRIANGKDHLLLLDFLWMHERHDLIKPANLISKNERQADAMQVIAETGAEVELEGLAGAADAEIERQIEAESEAKRARERALMDAVKANAGRAKRFIDAMSFALDIHATDLEQYEPEFGWESDDPTPKQLLAIANMGIDPASIKFKGLASKILDKAFTRHKMNLATPKQLAILKRFNCPDAEQVSFKQAGVLIDGYLGGARAHFGR